MIGYEVKDDLRLVKVKRLLGLPIYEKKRTDSRLERSFLGGLYRESVRFADFGEASRQSWLLGLPLWGRTLLGHRLRWHIGRSLVVNSFDILSVLSRDLDRLFASVSVRRVDGKKHVYVFWANSGESALLLGYFFEKLLVAQGLSGPDDVVVLCTKKYHQEMLSFLFPRIRSVVAKPRVLRHLTDDADAGDWRIQICFPGRYFAQLENTTRRPDGPENFFTWLRDYFGVKKNDSRFFAARRPDSERLAAELSSALQKLDVSREDLTRTVILSPSSFSCGRLTGAEIETVKECAANSGMRLYCNPSDPQDPRFLSFPELYAAATQAAGLVAIRSGLVDWLSLTGIPSFVVYRPFPDRGFNTPARTIEEVFPMFTLQGLPEAPVDLTETDTLKQTQLAAWFRHRSNNKKSRQESAR